MIGRGGECFGTDYINLLLILDTYQSEKMGRITCKPVTNLTRKQLLTRYTNFQRLKRLQRTRQHLCNNNNSLNTLAKNLLSNRLQDNEIYVEYGHGAPSSIPSEIPIICIEENRFEAVSAAPSRIPSEVPSICVEENRPEAVVNVNQNNKVDENIVHTFTNFKNFLRQCCLDMNIHQIQTTALLRILRTHYCFRHLPKSRRSFLKTGRAKISLLPVSGGVYWHIGFARSFQKHVLLYDKLPSVLELEINTDGLS